MATELAAGQVAIPESELNTLRSIKAMMDKAWDGKDTGAAFRKMLKQANPELKIPDDLAESAIAPVNAKIEETEKTVKGIGEKLDKFLTETKDRDDTAKLRSDIDGAVKKFGLDDEGKTKMLERMKATNSFDVEAAGAWVAHQAPKPKIITDHGIGAMSADLFGTTKQDDAFKDLHTGGDPFRAGGFFEQEANKVMNEFAQEAAA